MTFDKWYSEKLGLTVAEARKTPMYDICKEAWIEASNRAYRDGAERASDYSYGGTHRHPLDMD